MRAWHALRVGSSGKSLPANQQFKAIFWGSAAAIVMRVVLTVVAVQLLQVPYLKIIGGVLLLWIGVQLLVDSDDEGEVKAHGTIGAAIRTILVADLVMSVDNVLAVAGAADRAPESSRFALLIIGLGLSIPLIIVGSTLLLKIMERFPIIVTAGAALLGFLAGEMFATDPASAGWFHANMPEADAMFGGICAVLVVAVGTWLKRRRRAAASAA